MTQAPDLRMGVLTPRTAVVLLAGGGVRYRLPAPLDWVLDGPDGQRTGVAETVTLFLDDLAPGAEYTLAAGGAAIRFRTPPCAGLVNAADHGVNEGAPDNAAAFARAIAAVPMGGTLMISPGTYASGPLFLRSDMTLHLAEGATLRGVSDRASYPILPARGEDGLMLGSWEGLPAPSFASLITAIGCDRLSITGSGTIDGGGAEGDWWQNPKKIRTAWRPRTLYALRCKGLALSGVTVRNSPSWTLHPALCDGLRISGVTVWNPSDSPNTDGCDPEMCRDVVIEGTLFSVGDDCIAIKAGKRADDGAADHLSPTDNVSVRNCRMERGHGGVVIGSEMSGSITNVRITDCEFSETDRGLRIKTRRGRGGVVSGLTISDCEMDGVDTGFAANAHYFCDHDGHSDWVQSRDPAPVSDLTPHLRDIRITRVTVANTRLAVAAFLGLPEAPITGVTLKEISYDFDPSAQAAVPLMADHVPDMRHVDLWAENAEVLWPGHGAAGAGADDVLLSYFDAFATRFEPYKSGHWCYEDGLVYVGLAALHEATGEARWLAHLRRLVDPRVAPDGTIDGYDISEYNIDNILAGRGLFPLADAVGDLRYMDAAALLAKQLASHPRTAGGNYWHKLRYPWQVWLDGLFMGLPFQVEYGLRTGRDDLVADATGQLGTALGLLLKPANGLHAHAYDEKRQQPWADPVTGLNPDHWARANGWLAMALVDICGLIGKAEAERTGLARATADMLARIMDFQTANGLWLQVPDRPDLTGNYEEMSASAMFAYALIKAARLGLMPGTAEAAGLRAFDALAAVIASADGAERGEGFGPMCHVAGLGPFEGRFRDGTAAYYVSEKTCNDDPKGVGPMMMATAEQIRHRPR